METVVCHGVAKFLGNPAWESAKWIATTFRWHPKGEAPPIMGIVFAKATEGREVLRAWTKDCGNRDVTDDLRISIIEGSPPGKPYGYSVHICPNPETILARATAEGVVADVAEMIRFGRVNRMYPEPSSPPLLPRFKSEFAKHKEFLLAPVTRRKDGQLWVDVELGIIKKRIEFRNLSDITADDPDAAALVLPELIRPPEQ